MGQEGKSAAMDQDELIRQYNPRAAVPDHEVWKAHWALDSERARLRYKGILRAPYGKSAGQTVDIFPAREADAPIQIFIHGGGWRALDTFDHSLIVPMFHGAGAATVLLNYDLCPTAPLEELIRQIRAGLVAIWQQADALGGDPERIFVSGHSAGAHLAAMLCATDFGEFDAPDDVIKGATLISGLYDLRPIVQLPDGKDLQVPPGGEADVSPLANLPPTDIPLLIAVGEQETEGFIAQADDFAAACLENGSEVLSIRPEYDHHYSILNTFANPVTDLGKAVLAQMGLAT